MSGFEKTQPSRLSVEAISSLQYLVEKLPEFERSKQEFEIKVIEDANERTSRVMEKYGATPHSMECGSVHIISKEHWPAKGHGFFSRELNGTLIVEQENEDIFLLCVIHEMFHYKGVNFLPIPLTEAIVERLSNEAINLEDSSLSGEEVYSGVYTYDEYRKLLNELLETIIDKALPRINIDKTRVFSFFAKAHLTGHSHHITFFDELFGKGTFQKLNELSDDPSDLREFILSLNQP